MAFCEKCGNELTEGAGFCAKCGAKVGGQLVRSEGNISDISNSDQERINTAQKLSEIYDYFIVKGEQYDTYDSLTATINSERSMSKPEKIMLVICCIFGAFGFAWFTVKTMLFY